MRVPLTLAMTFLAGAAFADDTPDKYPGSVLYDKPVEVAPGVYSAIGATQPPTYENAGHNNNLSFIVTTDGVVVVNGGASWKLAEALDREIAEVTDQPVKLVINENGQGHSMLGNSYWAARNVPIVAQIDAAAEFAESEGPKGLEALKSYARENAEGTGIVAPTETFTDRGDIRMGNTRIEVLHLGPAHSPGDTQVWLPDQKVLIAGDIAFSERMPPIFEGTCTSCWIETFETLLEPLGAEIIVPRPRVAHGSRDRAPWHHGLSEGSPREDRRAHRKRRRSGRRLLRRSVAVGIHGHLRGTGDQERRRRVCRNGVRVRAFADQRTPSRR